MNKLVLSLAICTVLGLSSQTSKAHLVASVQSPSGESSMNVRPGDSFVLNLELTGPKTDTFDDFGIEVIFSAPGLVLDSYDFPSPVLTVDGPYADSTPLGPIDWVLEFAALTDNTGDVVSTGTLVVMNLTVPSDFPIAEVSVTTRPDFFGCDFFFCLDVTSGPRFSLNIVPEPITLALLGVGGLVVLRRRRT